MMLNEEMTPKSKVIKEARMSLAHTGPSSKLPSFSKSIDADSQ